MACGWNILYFERNSMLLVTNWLNILAKFGVFYWNSDDLLSINISWIIHIVYLVHKKGRQNSINKKSEQPTGKEDWLLCAIIRSHFSLVWVVLNMRFHYVLLCNRLFFIQSLSIASIIDISFHRLPVDRVVNQNCVLIWIAIRPKYSSILLTSNGRYSILMHGHFDSIFVPDEFAILFCTCVAFHESK